MRYEEVDLKAPYACGWCGGSYLGSDLKQVSLGSDDYSDWQEFVCCPDCDYEFGLHNQIYLLEGIDLKDYTEAGGVLPKQKEL